MDEEENGMLIAQRDPTKKDIKNNIRHWISIEYTPYRVFENTKDGWVFIGKFYPHKDGEWNE